ncbi:MAG: NirD/YgiW/YdeI family stress tolerance protein [Anaerobiospirillum succiniciproducens]|uniref:NirD/YgiW/YdeI family stress tolerance protein n=1 Tax=Anaerobiospirillum succiniciproducens TaxID=13335 RepID=UPI002A7544A4|nr:NirD/YgiW/YdeI family stress tolerance protein [Anaerobiospirillum succiniciproducens]MDY2797913.1 NirD/YgiW/YdeI family stress tolerance protein [Anaerobiospirillum succiniciproducens]
MALFNGVIKMHRRSVLLTAISLAFAASLAMPFSQAQAKDKYHEALRMPTGFDVYLTSVHQVQTGASDEAEVLIKGRLTGYLYDNNYEFTDLIGQSIEVELDDDVDWSYVHKDQLIEIYGEVDRNMFKVKIDAKHYRILEEVNNAAMQNASNATLNVASQNVSTVAAADASAPASGAVAATTAAQTVTTGTQAASTAATAATPAAVAATPAATAAASAAIASTEAATSVIASDSAGSPAVLQSAVAVETVTNSATVAAKSEQDNAQGVTQNAK